jgi:hypothetical protein
VKSPLSLRNDHITSAFVGNVWKAIKQLQSTKSGGLTGIPSFVANGCSDISASLLNFIFNLGISTLAFPAGGRKQSLFRFCKKQQSFC